MLSKKQFFSLCPTVLKLGYWSLPAFRLKLDLEVTLLPLLVLKPSDWDWNYTTESSDLYLAGNRLRTSQSPLSYEPIPHNVSTDTEIFTHFSIDSNI
jgi:hypothetical protein